MFAGALLLSEEEEEQNPARSRLSAGLRERAPRVDRAQRMVRKMVKLADLMR